MSRLVSEPVMNWTEDDAVSDEIRPSKNLGSAPMHTCPSVGTMANSAPCTKTGMPFPPHYFKTRWIFHGQGTCTYKTNRISRQLLLTALN